MVKIKNENPCPVSSTVFFLNAYGCMETGTITKIIPAETKLMQDEDYAIVQNKGITMGAPLSACWPTEQDCLDAEARRSEQQTAAYKDSICNERDLIHFLYRHDLTSENRDYDAQRAAVEKAKEFFGIDLRK